MFNLNDLPKSNIIKELDYEYLLSDRKNKLLSLFPLKQREILQARLELETDPLVKLLQESAYRELELRAQINYGASACMIAYATGGDLDNLVANFNVKRLLITAEDLSVNPVIEAVYEDDDSLRVRAMQAFHALSTAGPKTSYEFYAKSAHGNVLDVKALSPSPAVVDIVVLAKTNCGAPSDKMLATIENALNCDNVRPIGDRVNVLPCAVIHYQIKAHILVNQNKHTALEQGKTNLMHVANSHFKIGANLPLSAIYAALHNNNVLKVEIIEPAHDLNISNYEALYCDMIDINVQTQY